MNNIELYLLKFFFVSKNFVKFGEVFETKFLKDNSPELFSVLQAIRAWHDKYPDRDINSIEEFSLFYFTMFPAREEKGNEHIESLLTKLGAIEVEDAVARDYMLQHLQRANAAKTALIALEVAQGRKEYPDLIRALEEAQDASSPNVEDEYEFVPLDETAGRPEKGLRWRLDCLNKALGSLRHGHFGFLFARPEAGKTSFALDQCIFMAEQAKEKGLGPVVYFNNEQPGQDVMQRAVSAALGIDGETYFKHKAKANARFKERLGDHFLLYDRGHMTSSEVEKICKKYSPSLIVFDQLDNIKGVGSNKERDDLSLKALYQWARELAKEYCPVIAICQAGGTAEGKKWLTMDDVDGSKTAKQSAADWIIGIGQSHQPGLENIRHVSISKNKLPGDEDTDFKLKHGKFDIKILPQICRFEDI